MELHGNYIRISRSILQVLQSLSRDIHGIFISLVLFGHMTVLCEQSAIFQPVIAALSRPPSPRISPKPVFLVLSPGPRTFVKRKQKSRSTLFIPGYHCCSFLCVGPESQLKNYRLCVFLLFDLFPCCPVYKSSPKLGYLSRVFLFLYLNQGQPSVPADSRCRSELCVWCGLWACPLVINSPLWTCQSL